MSWLSLALLAAFLKSVSNVSEKQVLIKEDVLVYTSAFSFVIAFVSLPLLFFIDDKSISATNLGIIYISSLISVVASLTAAKCIKQLDISESAPLFALSPLLVTFLSIIFLGESINPLQIIGILISVFGVFVLEYHTHHDELAEEKKNRTGAYIILLISLIFFSFSVVMDRYVIYNRNINPLYALLIIQFFILFNIAVYDALFNKSTNTKLINPKLFLRVSFWTNVVCIIAHRVVHVQAVQLIGASVLNAVKQVSVFFTTIIGGNIFQEKHILQKLVGCACIISGILLVIIYSI
jgi:drug/metabolite transporter (DMT)-like permease